MARTVRRASGVEAHYPDDVWRLMDDAERRAANQWYSQMISNPHRPIPPQPLPAALQQVPNPSNPSNPQAKLASLSGLTVPPTPVMQPLGGGTPLMQLPSGAWVPMPASANLQRFAGMQNFAGMQDDERSERTLPVERQEDPITAWRNAYLVCDRTTVYLTSLNDSVRLPVVATATHGPVAIDGIYSPADPEVARYFTTQHIAPKPGCSCGFWAMKEKVNVQAAAPNYAPDTRLPVLLEVDLFGTVIEADHGYRAQYQRVLSVRLFDESTDLCCQVGFLCDEPPNRIWFPGDGPPVGMCEHHEALMETNVPLGVVHRVATLDKLSRRLKTEVRWS